MLFNMRCSPLLPLSPGIALSVWISKWIINISVSSLRVDHQNIPVQGLDAAIMAGVLLFAIVILSVVLYAKKARSIQPVQAIRYGMSETDNSRMAGKMNSPWARWIGFTRLPVTMALGLRHLFKNTKSSILTLLLTTMASSVLVLGYVLLTSITGIYQTAAHWGYDNANIAAVVVNKSTFPKAELKHVLEQDSRISNVGWQGNTTGVISPESSTGVQGQSISLNLSVLDGKYQELGFTTLRGDNPRHVNEIAIGVSIAQSSNKDLGDLIDIYIEGEKRTFLITGIYQAIANMSVSGRITIDAMRSVNPAYGEFDAIFINVKDITQADLVAGELNEQFKDFASVVTQKTLLDSVYAEAANILIYPMSLIGLLFIAVTFIIIFSTCRINIRKESRNVRNIQITGNDIPPDPFLGHDGNDRTVLHRSDTGYFRRRISAASSTRNDPFRLWYRTTSTDPALGWNGTVHLSKHHCSQPWIVVLFENHSGSIATYAGYRIM